MKKRPPKTKTTPAKTHPTASQPSAALGGTPWIPSTTAVSESTLRHLVYATSPQAAEQSSGGPPPPPPPDTCLIVTFAVPNTRSGPVITPHATTFDVREFFRMDATFSSAAGHHCGLCSYRQEVRGYYRYRLPGGTWQPFKKILANGKELSPTVYQEDGDPNGFPYGHRNGFNMPDDRYMPIPRVHGCIYLGKDGPGFTGLPNGSDYDVFLEFRGMIVETNNPNGNPLRTALWTVQL